MTFAPSAVFAAVTVLAAAAWQAARSRSHRDTWWHGLDARRKIAFGGALAAGGALAGIAWRLSPAAALGAVIAVTASTAVARTIRARLARGGR